MKSAGTLIKQSFERRAKRLGIIATELDSAIDKKQQLEEGEEEMPTTLDAYFI